TALILHDRAIALLDDRPATRIGAGLPLRAQRFDVAGRLVLAGRTTRRLFAELLLLRRSRLAGCSRLARRARLAAAGWLIAELLRLARCARLAAAGRLIAELLRLPRRAGLALLLGRRTLRRRLALLWRRALRGRLALLRRRALLRRLT